MSAPRRRHYPPAPQRERERHPAGAGAHPDKRRSMLAIWHLRMARDAINGIASRTERHPTALRLIALAINAAIFVSEDVDRVLNPESARITPRTPKAA